MRFVIEIEMEGEALESHPVLEVKRLLASVRVRDVLDGNTQKLLDINGNSCGSAEMVSPRTYTPPPKWHGDRMD